jgi:hypothetical protein
MRYIDDNCTVKLKGRVACEMGSQELIITELVLDNVLTDRLSIAFTLGWYKYLQHLESIMFLHPLQTSR